MTNGYTVSDSFENITVLYHRGCPQGFKFFGDDPEEHKTYIKEHHIEMLRQLMPNWSDFPSEFLRYFYLHSRCLLFTDGVWMSETAKYPHYLRYKPGTNVSFRVSGVTRFTSLTKNSGALCVGIDPDAEHIPNLRRHVQKVDKTTHFMPMSSNSIFVATENAKFGDVELPMGAPRRLKNDFDVLEFEKSGYLIEFTNEPMNLEDELVNYAHQWGEGKIEVFQR
tara:strand:+ start:2870 stop:3538 length:669 start_codon:yes stop_codon:yes gene_type:complete